MTVMDRKGVAAAGLILGSATKFHLYIPNFGHSPTSITDICRALLSVFIEPKNVSNNGCNACFCLTELSVSLGHRVN